MKNRLITISDSGIVNIPANVEMRDFEIAELFGIMYPTVRATIRKLLKNRNYYDNPNGGEVQRNGTVMPDYFGLDMIVSIAFSADSYKANMFRKHILHKLTKPDAKPMFIQIDRLRSNDSEFYC